MRADIGYSIWLKVNMDFTLVLDLTIYNNCFSKLKLNLGRNHLIHHYFIPTFGPKRSHSTLQ